MSVLTLHSPPAAEQTALNLRRWDAVLDDPAYRRVPGRVETDRHGRIVLSPPPAPRHGESQFRIGSLPEKLMPRGHIITECPISNR